MSTSKNIQPRKPKQQAFAFLEPAKKDFGGTALNGTRKTKRPLSFKKPMHIVLKSTKAKGRLSFVNHLRKLESTIDKISSQNQIKIYKKAVNFDHVHIVVHLSNENNYKRWIRLLPAQIAIVVGAPSNLFDARPHSTIIEWGRQFENVMSYMELNQMEIVGMRSQKNKTNFFESLRRHLV